MPTMKLPIVTLPVLLIGIQIISSAASGQTSTPTPEEEIRRLLDDQVMAWNRGDLESFMTTYWNSGDLTFYSASTPLSGWRATLERYQKRYQSEGNEMGFLKFTALKIEMLSGDAAYVRGSWHLARTTQEDLQGLFTLVVKRLPVGWKIIHDHTSSE
jgi:beta-aspartyl-peptidase (threonine type)